MPTPTSIKLSRRSRASPVPTVPPQPAYSSSNDAETADTSEGSTQPVRVPAITQELVAEPKPVREPGRRSPWLIIGPSLLLLALFAGGLVLVEAGGQSRSSATTVTSYTPVTQAATTATATLPGGFVPKTDTNHLYRFGVPASWVALPPPKKAPSNVEFTTYTDPTHSSAFEVESFAGSAQPGGAVLDQQALLHNSSNATPTSISQPSSIPLAGVTWTLETAKLNITQNGATLTQDLVVLSAAYNDTTYIIFYYSPDTPSGSQFADDTAPDGWYLFVPGLTFPMGGSGT